MLLCRTQRGVCATCAPICTVDYITARAKEAKRKPPKEGECKRKGLGAWGKHLDLSYGLHLINKLIFQSTNRWALQCGRRRQATFGMRRETAVKSSMLPKIWELTFENAVAASAAAAALLCSPCLMRWETNCSRRRCCSSISSSTNYGTAKFAYASLTFCYVSSVFRVHLHCSFFIHKGVKSTWKLSKFAILLTFQTG